MIFLLLHTGDDDDDEDDNAVVVMVRIDPVKMCIVCNLYYP